MSSRTCVRCSKPAKYCCSRCKQFWYCSDVCQKQHWYHGHKGQCAVLSGQVAASSQINTVKQASSSDPTTSPILTPATTTAAAPSAAVVLSPYVRPARTWLYDPVRMAYTDPLLVFLRAEHPPAQCALVKRGRFCLVCEMKSLVHQMLDENYQYLAPREILLHLRDINMDFILGQQEDAHDFHNGILQKMHDALMENSKEASPEIFKSLTDPHDKQRVEETSLIYQIFGGYQLSHVRCTECGRITDNTTSFLDLNLDLSAHAASVEEALRNWCKIEVLPKSDGFRCEQCDRAVAIQKQLTICAAPPVLCIQLKRFDMMRGGMKINKSVAFREELDLGDIGIITKDKDGLTPPGNYRYQLYAMIAHYGPTIFGGHYVSFVKSDGKWFLFDDEKVHLVDKSIVLKQNAYLLYYRRVAASSAPTSSSSSASSTPVSSAKSTPTQQRNKLTESGERNALTSSTGAGASEHQASLVYLAPIHKLFYNVDGAEITSLLLSAEMPLEEDPLANSRIDVHSFGGATNFVLITNQYRLELDIPFSIAGAKSEAIVYKANRTIVAYLHVISADSQESQEEHAGQIEIKPASSETKSPDEDFHFDPEHVLELEAKLDDVAHRATHEDEKFKAGQQKIEQINVETNSYPQLYRDIERFNATLAATRRAGGGGGGGADTAGAATPKSSAGKVGRNDTCPCGSGKKYKKCHGK